jgi:hypothetical protein
MQLDESQLRMAFRSLCTTTSDAFAAAHGLETTGFESWLDGTHDATLRISNNVREYLVALIDAADVAIPDSALPDRSTPLATLRTRLQRWAGEPLIIVDGDNFPDSASIALELFQQQPPSRRFAIVAFVGCEANFKAFVRAATQPWFSFVRAQVSRSLLLSLCSIDQFQRCS